MTREGAHGSLISRLTPRSAREARLELSPPAVRPSAAGRKRKRIDVGCCNEVDDSGSTTSEPRGGRRAAGKREVTLKKKARQRRSKFLSEAVTRAMDGGLNFLEASSVTKPVRERYEREVREFVDYCDRPPALALRSSQQVDKSLSQYFNYQFFQGHEAAKGEQTLAGLMFMRPEFGKWGSLKLPSTWRALRGWRKRAPARSRRAWALGVWAALAWRLEVTQGLLMCVYLLLSLTTYCRPGELMGLRRRGLIKPTPGVCRSWSILLFPNERVERSKTSLSDVCVALDSKWAQCLTPLWPLLAKGDPDSLVFTFEYPAFMRAFQSCVKELGIEDNIIPYQTRHSGPSIDVSRGLRCTDEVQRRGQWKHVKSTIRYEKGARLGESWARLHPRLQVVCELCETHLADIVLRRPHPVSLHLLGVVGKANPSSTVSREVAQSAQRV